jgi:uncharacterized protein
MKFALTLSLLLCAGAVSAAEAPKARVQTVERLLEASHASNAATLLQAQIQQQLQQQAQQADAADRPIVEKYIKEMSTTVLPEIAWSKLKPDMVKAYAATFTDQEIADMTKFYESPTGQSYVKKAPELSRQTLQLTQARLQALTPKVQDISRRMEAEVQARKKSAAPAAAPKK